MKKSENLLATLLAVYAIILVLCIAIYAIFKLLDVDIALATNLLLWSATIFAPLAILMTYTSWREQKGVEVIANYCKGLVIQLVELEHLSNQICNYLIYKPDRNESIKILNKKFISIFNEQEDAFKFLGKAISDGELKDQIRRFQNQCLLNYVRYNALVGSENLEHIANITPQLGSIHREQNSNLRTELMKYVLYQKE
ncbi:MULTISPECIES: hypothetical protein [Acinetobacter]|uniref:hypothetical protein n=1 Tax=Acinetobacter TaxID=469 RepID=UPI0002CD98E5|nr:MULTISPECIES: hypothetical protein [Acinetobacter]ENW25046.1 hypothetical protein F925_01714 [Acinetobacter lwoffii NCTC 5866 = CIP 64.10 = NIPH 512]MCO8090080.1 hypothetical protein [Acinetobacter pseudolwoffii]MDH5818769.1 hypothetical protein [Acinetobacter pseudolwoffii]UBX51574.1 hypothetical protein LDO52_09440 [Acinetobacter pseudolwoffii]